MCPSCWEIVCSKSWIRAPEKGRFWKWNKNACSLKRIHASFYACFGAKRFFYHIPTKEICAIALSKLAIKIKGFKQAFEVASDTCRQTYWLKLTQFRAVPKTPYGPLGRLSSACVSPAQALCTHKHMTMNKVKDKFKVDQLCCLIL